ncbi:hypothetical protein [Actinotalea solisilvae]|uniref:hypothetical protein n=1 Tax=Actinotalea solisilvae TaxID=2072922 RepID=UPI0018F22377|nr:hypothetical protein [Actinotalea solisilvae]
MTTISRIDQTVSVRFTRREKIAGLLRDQELPTAAVVRAEVVPDGLAALHGVRAPGLGLPGLRSIGTWRSRSGTTLASVRAGRPALRVVLTGERWAEMLLDVDAPEQAAAALAAAV